MTFDQPLIPGALKRRYKRFLADVTLEDGREVVAHCPNSGSMKTCAEPGWEVRLSPANNPKRKLKYTWEMVHNGDCWIGINTQHPNRVAHDAMLADEIPELTGYDSYQREVKYGENSRIDVLATRGDERCYVEIKNVTLVAEDGHYAFPDAVTKRGQKHLEELMAMVDEGHRAVMLFFIQRSDGDAFRAAHEIDPDYAAILARAAKHGVEVLAYRAAVSPDGIALAEPVRRLMD